MRFLTSLLAASLLLTPLVARAQASQSNPVVVELFTSQGCSSCPPADALLAELAQHEGVIALALHVDYWDYLGWEDSFASPAYTARQRAYAKKAHSNSIFTPQIIVQGEDRLIGHHAKKIHDRIAARRGEPAPVRLELRREGAVLRIAISPTGPEAAPSEVHVVRFIPSLTVAIASGENAGRDITYVNIVTDWTTIARWDGAAPLELSHRVDGDKPLAVIVQRAHMGPVLTAAALP